MGGVVRIIKNVFSPPSAPAYQPPAAAVAPTPAPVAPPQIAPTMIGGEDINLAPEVEAPPAVTEQETLLKKKKKGRYNTILSGREGSLGSANIERKSLLGN